VSDREAPRGKYSGRGDAAATGDSRERRWALKKIERRIYPGVQRGGGGQGGEATGVGRREEGEGS